MKKVLKVIVIVAVVILAAYSVIATIAMRETMKERDQYKAQVQELTEGGTDISTIRGLAYELLFDKLVLGTEYDIEKAIDKMIEQYELSEFEEMELLAMLEALISRYELE